jgi:hypothetical protein
MSKNIKSVKFSTGDNKKKMKAVFYNEEGKKVKTTQFGQKGASDYTINKDPVRKKAYIDRHKARENWSDKVSAGALSRWVLWNQTSKKASIADYKKRFKLK